MHIICVKLKGGEVVIGELVDVLDEAYIIDLPLQLHIILGGEETGYQTYHQPALYYPYGQTSVVEIKKENVDIADSANEYYSLLYETCLENLINREVSRYDTLIDISKRNKENIDHDIPSKVESTGKQSIRESKQFLSGLKKLAETDGELYGHVTKDDGDISFLVPGTETKH